MCSAKSLFIQFGAKGNDMTCHFILSDGRNSFDSLSAERMVFRPKTLETVQFWQFPLDFSLLAEILFRLKKGNWDWKLKPENFPKLNWTSEVADSCKYWEFGFKNDTNISKIESTFNSYNLFSFSLFLSNFI